MWYLAERPVAYTARCKRGYVLIAVGYTEDYSCNPVYSKLVVEDGEKEYTILQEVNYPLMNNVPTPDLVRYGKEFIDQYGREIVLAYELEKTFSSFAELKRFCEKEKENKINYSV